MNQIKQILVNHRTRLADGVYGVSSESFDKVANEIESLMLSNITDFQISISGDEEIISRDYHILK